MADSLNAKTIKQAFAPYVQSNVDKYYEMINKSFDDYIAKKEIKDSKGNKIVFTNADINKLKTYAWATVATENDKCQPGDEGVSRLNTMMFTKLDLQKTKHGQKLVKSDERAIPNNDGQYHLVGNDFGLYDNRKVLGNKHFGEGEEFKGRGFIQLTGRDNYRRYAVLADIPNLESNPSLASDPNNAAKILAAYILQNSVRVLDALNKNDMKAAREVVNGKNKKGALPHGYKEFTKAYEKIDGAPAVPPAGGAAVPVRGPSGGAKRSSGPAHSAGGRKK